MCGPWLLMGPLGMCKLLRRFLVCTLCMYGVWMDTPKVLERGRVEGRKEKSITVTTHTKLNTRTHTQNNRDTL